MFLVCGIANVGRRTPFDMMIWLAKWNTDMLINSDHTRPSCTWWRSAYLKPNGHPAKNRSSSFTSSISQNRNDCKSYHLNGRHCTQRTRKLILVDYIEFRKIQFAGSFRTRVNTFGKNAADCQQRQCGILINDPKSEKISEQSIMTVLKWNSRPSRFERFDA